MTTKTKPSSRPRQARRSKGTAARKRDRPPLQVDLREMELDDLPAVFALGERLFRADEVPNLYRTWDEYELVDHFSSDGEYCLVAEHEERLVGFVIGTVIHKRKSAWTYGYVVWLGVEPKLDGRGVARRLISRLTEMFIEAGARIMLVDTDANNTRAVEFFERAGFGSPVEHVFMSKNLTSLPQYQRRRAAEDDNGKEAKAKGRRSGRANGGGARPRKGRHG